MVKRSSREVRKDSVEANVLRYLANNGKASQYSISRALGKFYPSVHLAITGLASKGMVAVIEKTKSRTNTIKNLYAITDRGYWMSCSLIGPGADPDRILESNPHLPKECKAIAEAWKVAPELYARWLGLAASQITSTDPRKVMREAITILIPMIAGMPEGQQDEARRIILSAPESKALLRATIEEAKSLLADFDKP